MKNWLLIGGILFSCTLFAQPTITSFSPNKGPVGTLVTVTGSNLSNPTNVTIGGVAAIPISNSGTSLVAMVMPGATSGTVAVTTDGGTVSGSDNFTVTATQIPNKQQGNKLVGSGAVGNAYLGFSMSVSADGNTAIIGGPMDDNYKGAVWIFTRNGNTWTQQGNKLVGSGAIGNAKQGSSVAISGDGNTAIVGGQDDNKRTGAVWIFTRNGNIWTQQGSKLVGTGVINFANQGWSVAISADGNTAIVGGVSDNNYLGAAWIFARNGNNWTQLGNKLEGTSPSIDANFGFSVALSADGNTAIIGGVFDTNNGTTSGAAWIFSRNGTNWAQQGNKLIGSGAIGNSFQGWSVGLSADGNTAIVGGLGDDGNKGASWVFTRSGNTWTQQGNKLVGNGAVGNAQQGAALALSADGNTAIVGGRHDDGFKGAAWIYTRSGNTWAQQGNKLLGSGADGNANQGSALALSADGNTLLVGGESDDLNKGATWVFSGLSIDPTIISFTPTSAKSGDTITILGSNLSGTSSVTLGGTSVASFQVISSTLVTAVVGSGATGSLSITTNGGTASLSGFIFLASAPAINSMSTVTCSGVGFTITPVDGINGTISSGTTYSWSIPQISAGLTGAMSRSNQTTISGTLLNTTNTSLTAVYTVIPYHPINGTGDPFTLTVTVHPTAVINTVTSVTCSGVSFTITPTHNISGIIPQGTLFTWMAPQISTTSLTGGQSDFNKINISGSLFNNTNNIQTATYIVTPNTSYCGNSNSFSVIVTVYPIAQISPLRVTVCSGVLFRITPTHNVDGIIPAGTTYRWNIPTYTSTMTGGASAVGQSTVFGTLRNTQHTTQTATYIVTPSIATCGDGAPFTVTVTVPPTAEISTITTVTCSGVPFVVTPNNGTNGIVPDNSVFSWSVPTFTGTVTGGASATNNVTTIFGLLSNRTNTTQTVTYRVISLSGNCTGAAFTVIVTLNPTPEVSAMSRVVCNGVQFTISPANGTNGIVPQSTLYTWPVPTFTASVTGGTSGTDQLSVRGTLTNQSNVAQEAYYNVIPRSGNCVGANFNITIYLNPAPVITAISSVSCSGVLFRVTPTNGTNGIVPAGTTYRWNIPTYTSTMTGGASAVGQSTVFGTLRNTQHTTQTATYVVTPSIATCGDGAPFTVTVTIHPMAEISTITMVTCSGVPFVITPTNVTNGIVPDGTIYSWSAPVFTGTITGGASATNNPTIVTGTLLNRTNLAQTVTYWVTPRVGNCMGAEFSFIVSLQPKPEIESIAQTTNSGTPFAISPTNDLQGIVPFNTRYSWNLPTLTSVSVTGALSASNQANIFGTLTNATSSIQTATYTINPIAGNCTGANFTLIVSSLPSIFAPTISSFTPTSAGTGATITITGTNLNNTSAITLGGISVASFQVLSSTTISAVVGAGATGAVSVTSAGGTAALSGFIFIPPTPTIISFAPNSGPVGTLVTITGTSLNNPTAINIGGVAAIPISFSGTTLVAMVMPGASNGSVIVTTPGGTASSANIFNVTNSKIPNIQQGNKLVGNGAIGNSYQGERVALSADGNTAIIGGSYDDGFKGAAWIYTRSGSTWTQQGNKLVGTGSSSISFQGSGVAISADGNTAIIGGYADNNNTGAAWVFTRNGNSWTQQGSKLVGTGAAGSAQQGYSVALSADGNTVVIGGWSDDSNKGAAWIFTRSGNTWSQSGTKLVGSGANGNSQQGFSVALSADGNTTIIGGNGDNSNKGAAWVFNRSGNSWTQQGSKLTGNDVAGNPFFGASVALSADGNTAILGGFRDSTKGAAWVFIRNGNSWTQQGSKLVATGSVGFTEQGIGVSISADGNTAIVGDRTDISEQGGAWIYTRTSGTWTQRGSKISGTGTVGRPAQGVGVAISADGNTAIIGGPNDDGSKGAAWVFIAPPPPTITSFTPTSASTGSVITITGTHLIGTSAITLGGTSVSSFTVVDASTISAVVGNGSTGALSLVTPNGTANLAGFIFISLAPSVNSLTSVTCSGTNFTLSPVNGVNGTIPSGTTYSWAVPQVSAGLTDAMSRSNQTAITGTILNSTNSVQTAVYTVIPSHPTLGIGNPFSVTIFVNPQLVITPLSITGCGKVTFKAIPLTNTNGPVSDSSLHIWTSPNQTISFITRVRPENNLYIIDTIINELNSTKEVIRILNPSKSCFDPNYMMSIYLNPIPSINAMTSTICSGVPFSLAPSNGINGLVPDSISYSWNIPILSASLTGGNSGSNLTSIDGQLFNNSNVTQTATYFITPMSTNGNCAGAAFTLTVSVSPTPSITPMTITACRRVTFSAVPFNGTNGLVPASTRYSWDIPTQTASIIGGRSGVNQPFLVDTLANESNQLQEAYYTIKPSVGNCVGANFTLTVSISPVAVINEITTSVCSGASFVLTPTNGTNGIVPSGVRYIWNAPITSGGITGGQSNNSPPNIFGTLRNTSNTAQTATYYVTPFVTTCGLGPVFTVTVTVLPVPSIQHLSTTTNSGIPFAITPVNSIDGVVPQGTLYSWNVPIFNGTVTGGQAASNRTSITGTLQNTSAVLQSATYIVTPATGNCTGLTFTISVNINPLLTIQSFNPKSAGKGSTVTIQGKGFTSVNRVSFGGTAALSFTILSDTSMNAVVGDGNSGFVKIESAFVNDSLAGFIWGSPVIQIDTPDSIRVFGAEKGKNSQVQSYLVSGQFLQNNLLINAPDSFQISRSASGSYVKTLSIEPINGTIDTSRIFVRFKSDAPGVFSGIISHSSTAAINKSLSVTGNANCDSIVYLTPVINNIKTDTVICFKDSVTLTVSNGTFSKYFWSNGDTTNKLVIKNSGTFNVKVGSGNGCISYQSLNIKTNKNTNTTPSLALVGNRLISTSAPRYRWLFNNNYVPGNISNSILPNKVGLYAVETSNDSICWDRSLDYPIMVLSTPLVNDTLNVKIFPNPTSTGTFFVVATLKKVTNVVVRVTVSDANGNILTQTNPFIFFGREIKIPISLTFKGTAFVRTDVNGDIVTQTVILQ